MKQARQIRILAALTAAAAACAVFLSLFPKTASAEDAAPSRKITDMSAAEVQAVVLHNQSGTIGLLNLPSGVAVEGGDSSIYSQEKLVSLIYRLAHLDSSGAVEQGAAGMAAFGLETPAAQVSLLTQDETVRLYLGRRCPVSQEYYLLREGDTEIHLVEEETARMLLQGVSDLRQLELFPALTGESVRALRRIVIENSRGRVVLDQLQTDTISSFFGMTAPVAAPLNWKDVDDLVLVPLRALSPERFVSSDVPLSQYGLNQPEYTLELTLDGKEYRCGFVRKDPDTYYCAALDGMLVSEIPAEKVQFLEAGFMDLIGSSIYTRSVADLSRLSAKYEGHLVSLEVSGESTALTATVEGRQMDYLETLAFYNRIDTIPAAAALTGEETIQSQPALTLVFTLRSGQEDILEFYAVSDRQYAVFLNGSAEFTTYATVVTDLINAFHSLSGG